MIQKLKKLVYIMLIFMIAFSSFSYAALNDPKDWEYSDVKNDDDGAYIIGTDSNGNTHKMRWNESRGVFTVTESTTSGTGQQQGTVYEIDYDNYKEKQGADADIPSKDQMTEKNQEASKEKETKAQEQKEAQESKSKSEQGAIEKAKGGETATYHENNTGNDFYLTQLDNGEWVVIQRSGVGDNYLVLHWNSQKGAFYADDGEFTRTIRLNDQVMKNLKEDAEQKGLDVPKDEDIIPKDENGEIQPGVEEENHKMEKNVVLVIRQTIALWFYIMRYIGAAAMLVVLLVLGVKIAITSAAGEKAAYKKMLVDWVVGFIVMFSIHYIMIFIVFVNQAGIDLIKDTANRVYSEDKRVYVSEDASEYGSKDYQSKTNEDIEVSLYESVRTRAFDAKLTNGCVGMVLYACLVYFAYKFTFVYLKRILNIAILTVMAPLVGLSFALNKILTGKATIFGKWLREYVTVVLIQFFHALVYVTFVMGVLKIALTSVSGVIFVLVLLKFMADAEKIIREIFGMDSNAIRDLAGTMQKGPSDYVSSLSKGVGAVVGVGAAGQANREITRLFTGAAGKVGMSAFERHLISQANKDIKDKDDISEQNLQNSQGERNYIDELLDYDDDEQNLTDIQQQQKDIVESQQYIDALARGEQYTGKLPKYHSEDELNLAKQRLASNPKIIAAAFKQRVRDAFDFRTYTERYVETDGEGSFTVKARVKTDKENIHKRRHIVFRELHKQNFSAKNLIGYTDEDMQELREGFKDIIAGPTGILTTIVGIGAIAESKTFGLAAVISGLGKTKSAVDKLSSENQVEYLPKSFRNNPALSIDDLDKLNSIITEEGKAQMDSYVADSISSKHPGLARKLATPLELVMAFTLPGGRYFRNVSKARWKNLQFNMKEERKALEKTRQIIIHRIEQIKRDEKENAEARVSMQGEISDVKASSLSDEEKKKKLKGLRNQLRTIDKNMAKLDKKLKQYEKQEAEIFAQIDKEESRYLFKSGGIGYSSREAAVRRGLAKLKEVEKEISLQKAEDWKKIKEAKEEERKKKNQDPYYQFQRNGFEMKILKEAQGPGDEEGVTVPLYDLEESVRATANYYKETDEKTVNAEEDAAAQARREYEENLKEAQERRKQRAEETGKNVKEIDVKLPESGAETANFSYKVVLADVKVAIINAAAKKNKTVREYELTTGNTNEIKNELFKMITRMYGLEGNLPPEVVQYVNSLDSTIAYAKSVLVASEAAASAIITQIEENGQENVNVEEAIQEVKSSLKEYFEEVENAPLPESLKKHDYIEEDDVIVEAGYDTIDNLAEKAMSRKLESMADIIRVRNKNADGTLSPESAEAVKQLRKLMETVRDSNSAAEENNNKDREAFRMFASEKKAKEKEDKSKLGFNPDDVQSENAELDELLDSIPDEVGDELMAEMIADNEGETETKKAKKLERQIDQISGTPSQEKVEAVLGGAGSDDSGADETDEVGGMIQDAFDEVENSDTSTSNTSSPDSSSTKASNGNPTTDEIVSSLFGNNGKRPPIDSNNDGSKRFSGDDGSVEYVPTDTDTNEGQNNKRGTIRKGENPEGSTEDNNNNS